MRQAPDVHGVKNTMTGRVAAFDPKTGTGSIEADVGTVLITDRREIKTPGQTLAEGQLVEFDLVQLAQMGGPARAAANIVPVPEPALARRPLHPCPGCRCAPSSEPGR